MFHICLWLLGNSLPIYKQNALLGLGCGFHCLADLHFLSHLNFSPQAKVCYKSSGIHQWMKERVEEECRWGGAAISEQPTWTICLAFDFCCQEENCNRGSNSAVLCSNSASWSTLGFDLSTLNPGFWEIMPLPSTLSHCRACRFRRWNLILHISFVAECWARCGATSGRHILWKMLPLAQHCASELQTAWATRAAVKRYILPQVTTCCHLKANLFFLTNLVK